MITNKLICIVEYIHVASLIIDDIMDNDIERRSQLAVFVEFGFHKAQLIAIFLLFKSQEYLCEIQKYFIVN